MIKFKEFLDTCDFVPYVIIYTLEEEGPVFEGDAHLLYRQDKYKQLLTSSVENWGSVDDITDRFAFWITLDVVDFIPFDESYRKNKLSIKESDDKITAKNFQELISKLEDHGYSCGNYYDITRPESNWLYITKNGDPYEAEFYRYSDGEYELYLHNIHPTKRRNESMKRRNRNKLTEKSNFDTVEKAIKYYYPKWYYDDMSVNDIFDNLEKLGHSQDFTDAVIDGITSKYENEEDYELDESKMIHGRNKRLKEQVEDFEDTKDIVLVKSWLDDNGFDYEYVKSNQSASWFNVNGQKRRIPRLEPKKNKVYSYMNNIRSLLGTESYKKLKSKPLVKEILSQNLELYLQDFAQEYGGIDYNDISDLSKCWDKIESTTQSRIRKFVSKIKKACKETGLDAYELSQEYPQDKENCEQLVKHIKSAIKRCKQDNFYKTESLIREGIDDELSKILDYASVTEAAQYYFDKGYDSNKDANTIEQELSDRGCDTEFIWDVIDELDFLQEEDAFKNNREDEQV